MGAGRPSDYTKWKARAICMRLSFGESLRSICERKGYPSRHAVFRWISSNDEFRDQYAKARELQAEYYLDEIIDIADDGTNDYYEKEGKDGSTFMSFNGENVQRSRLRVDTRKWAMERMAAKKYGPQQKVDHTSSDGSMRTYSPADYDAAKSKLDSSLDDLD